jgi:hypothetical protein
MLQRNSPPGLGGPDGRRRSGRARLEIPARLVLLEGYYSCTVDNLSRSGARITCERELRRGDQGILKRDGLDQFFVVQWVRGERCGLRFDDNWVTEEAIRELRMLSDVQGEEGDAALREAGRNWARGDNAFSNDR